MQLISSQTQLQHIAEHLSRHIDGYGYMRVETPILQPADLFLTKAGDHIIQRLFTFDRAGRQFALRPEFTASAAKFYADHADELRPPTRWQFAGATFADADGSNAVEQQFSVGAELIGSSELTADAEIIALTIGGLRTIGIEHPTITLGSVRLIRALLSSYALDARTQRFIIEHLEMIAHGQTAQVIERFDRLATDGAANDRAVGTGDLSALLGSGARGTLAGRSTADILRRLQNKADRAAARGTLLDALGQLERLLSIHAIPTDAIDQIEAVLTESQGEVRTAVSELQSLVDLLIAQSIRPETLIVQPSLARDWNYYTAGVFEIRTSSNALLAGGGRYDDLIRLFGGPSTPAVGVAFYVDTLLTAIETNGKVSQQ